jgi:hypothetical protein
MVTKMRELIDCGFDDAPEILDRIFECCIEAIMRDLNRSAAKRICAHTLFELSVGCAAGAGSVRTSRERCVTKAG